jgi:nitrite reductase/ring-hydroxylating ferredoxin subunit
MDRDELAPLLVSADGRVPKARYVDRAFAELEQQHLWSRVWQVAAREEQVAATGAFVEYEIGDESVLVVRGDDGRLHAFHNSCLHRGTRLAEGSGSFDGCVRCPFHGWRYDLDGRLVEVVDRHEFPSLPDRLALAPVRVDTWGGFVFVNLDPAAPPLLDYLDPLPRLLAPYRLEDMRLRSSLTTVLPANWKVVVDAFNESYHVQGTHPQILPWTDDVSIEYEQFDVHAHYGRLPTARRALRPSPRLGLGPGDYDEGEILAGLVAGLGGAFLRDERALVDEVRSRPVPPGSTLLREYQQRRRDLLATRGLDVSGFELDQLTSADDVYWFPNLVGPVYPGSAILFRTRPLGLDPDRAVHDTWVLEWPDPRAARPSRAPEVHADWTERDWGEITNQDYANMARVQAGMKSRGFEGLRLNPRQEGNIAHMHRVIDRYLTT